MKTQIKLLVLGILVMSAPMVTQAQDRSLAGTYKALLQHAETEFFQLGEVTLRTVNPTGGDLKISGTVKVYFGETESNEYFTYSFPEVQMNLLTRQLSMRNAENDVSLIGILKGDRLEGTWYSSILGGEVGAFVAQKGDFPEPKQESILVTTVSGDYRGKITNTHPEGNLPENATISLVTRQDTENPEAGIIITGSARFYYGEFGTLEYVQSEFESIQFNFYTRLLTARTKEYGVTYKGILGQNGIFIGTVYADGFGKMGTVSFTKQIN